MTPEKLFHESLALGLNWELIASRFERESGAVDLDGFAVSSGMRLRLRPRIGWRGAFGVRAS
jgi:hypothetical protein